MSSFQGIWVPLVTPFRHGEIDFAALPRLLDHLLNAGVAGVVVCGTTGEAAALEHGEQLHCSTPCSNGWRRSAWRWGWPATTRRNCWPSSAKC